MRRYNTESFEYNRGAAIGIIGWDIGGVHVKASWLPDEGSGRQVRVTSRPFEIWRDKNRLMQVLHEAYADVHPEAEPEAMAVTMSAELSDVFDTKREGVLFILDCVRNCFPDLQSYCLNVSGDFYTLEKAHAQPLDFAAANWVASAHWIARKHPNGFLVDVGSTTTDIIPILNGEVCARGHTDMERLISGELVYTGALRTNLSAIVPSIPVAGRMCRVASEYFAVSGDVHLILGHILPEDYTSTTPDNRPPTVDSARSRLARIVCADTEMLLSADIDALALYIHEQQVLQIRSGLEQVVAELPELRDHPVFVYGMGAFLGREAARSLGLAVWSGESDLNSDKSSALPCLAAAHLLAVKLKEDR